MSDDKPQLVIPDTDAGKAEVLLREAFIMGASPGDKKVRLAAINTVLNFTKSKPESKSKVTLDRAEDFLAAVADDLKSK